MASLGGRAKARRRLQDIANRLVYQRPSSTPVYTAPLAGIPYTRSPSGEIQYLEYFPGPTYTPEKPPSSTPSGKGGSMQTLVFLLLVAFAAGVFCGCLVQRAVMAWWYRTRVQ